MPDDAATPWDDDAATPWDLAHARVADQLGVAPGDVVFAEPDIVNDIYRDPFGDERAGFAAVGDNCSAMDQDSTNGEAIGPLNGWHLGANYSQLVAARNAVAFMEPRMRIAHHDTG